MMQSKKMTAVLAKLQTAAYAVALFLFTAGVALGQEPPPSNDKSGWVLGYALVVLAIGLGLMVVCRPGSRTTDIKIDDD